MFFQSSIQPLIRLLGRTQYRSITLSAASSLKKIEKTEDKSKNEIIIEGKYIDTVDQFGKKIFDFSTMASDSIHSHPDLRPCALCELEKRDIFVQYTDILVLRQFLQEDGFPLPRKVTGLCKKQQKKLIVLLKHARAAGLTLTYQPNLLDGSKASSDPRKRPEHLKWNAYFDTYEKMKKTQKYL